VLDKRRVRSDCASYPFTESIEAFQEGIGPEGVYRERIGESWAPTATSYRCRCGRTFAYSEVDLALAFAENFESYADAPITFFPGPLRPY
jgi:hypothetical protein